MSRAEQARRRLKERDEARCTARDVFQTIGHFADQLPSDNARRAFWKRLKDLCGNKRVRMETEKRKSDDPGHDGTT